MDTERATHAQTRHRARTAAFGGVGEAVLAEGMMSYLMDTNAVEVYDGTEWVAISGGADVLQVQVFS